MQFDPHLIPATLLRRYKRFLADVILPDGREVTVHCANPGKMIGVSTPGARIWLQPATNPKRKLQWSWLLTELEGGHLAGIDTSVPNRIVAEALAARAMAEFADWPEVVPEVKYGTGSRIDFLLRGAGRPDLYLEVKNVHLQRDGTLAEFPDSVTARGTKHLHELAEVVAAGHMAAMLYVVQRTDCDAVGFAEDYDPAYCAATRMAREAGVTFLARATRISVERITLDRALPVIPA